MKQKNIFLLLLAIFLTTGLSAQVTKIDSLKNTIKNAVTDTTKVKLYERIATLFINTKPDSTIFYAKKGLAVNNVDKKSEAALYILLGYAYKKRSEQSVARSYFFKSLKINELIKNNHGIVVSHNNIGVVYLEEGNYKKAKKNLYNALAISKKYNDKEGLLNTYTNLGLLFVNQAKYSEGAKCYNEAIGIAKELGLSKSKVILTLNLGLLYMQIGQYEDAEEYLKKALTVFQMLGDKKGESLSYYNLASLFSKQNKSVEAIQLYRKALKLDIQRKDFYGQYVDSQAMGACFTQLQNYEKALGYYSQAKTLKNKMGTIPDEGGLLLSMGTTYMELGNLNASEDYCKQALLIAEKHNQLLPLYNVTHQLAIIYTKKGNYKTALEYRNKEIILSDSILTSDNLKDINDLKQKYEASEKDQKIKDLEKQRIAEERLNQAKMEKMYSLVAGIILLLVFVISFFYFKNKSNKLKQEKKLLELKKKQQQSQIEVLDNFKKEMSSMLHTDTGSKIMGTILHLQNRLGKAREIDVLTEVYYQIQNMSHLMQLPDFINTNLQEELNGVVRKFESESLKIDSDIISPSNWENVTATIQLYIFKMIQELLLNTMKYAQANSVNIKIKEENSKIFVTYNDNGIGYNPNELEHLRGFKIEIRDRVKSLSGNLKDASQPGKGVHLLIDIPLQ